MKMFLLMDPPTVTAQMSKVTVNHKKPVFYKPDKVKKAKRELIKYLAPFAPSVPLEGALELDVALIIFVCVQNKK
jgi:Holliday junction resolvase RusA-like endonuclease